MVYASCELIRSLTLPLQLTSTAWLTCVMPCNRADLFFTGTLAEMKPYGLVQQYADSRVDADIARRVCGQNPHLCEELTPGQGVHMLTLVKTVGNTLKTSTPLCLVWSWCTGLLTDVTVCHIRSSRGGHGLCIGLRSVACIMTATAGVSKVSAMYENVTASE